MVKKSEACCGNCLYYQALPFTDEAFCENKLSDFYHCECDSKEDVCKEYIGRNEKIWH